MNQQMKRWQDMSPGKRAVILTIGVIQLLLLLAAQLDLTFRPAEQVRGKKSYWRLGALISFWGPLAYFIFGIRSGPAAEAGLFGVDQVPVDSPAYAEENGSQRGGRGGKH